MSIEKFKKITPCIVLLGIKAVIGEINITFLNGLNHLPMFSAEV